MNRSQQGRPPFAQLFPDDARIHALVDAFTRGDYATVRKDGATLARGADDEAVRKAAQVILDRTKPDRLTRALLALTALLLVTLSAWWVAHGKRPPGSAAPHVEHVHALPPMPLAVPQ